jgi:hypothetical protein
MIPMPVNITLTGHLATFYASVSASFVIEQQGLPKLSVGTESTVTWNGDSPQSRVDALRARYERSKN